MFRTIAKWSISVIGILILAVFILLIFFSLPPGEKILKAVLETQLSKALNQNIIITSLETNLLTRLQIDGFYILDNKEDSSTNVISLDNIVVKFKLIEFLNNKISIKSIEINKLELNVQQDSSGNYNLHVLNPSDTITTNQSEEPGYKLFLGSLTIDTLVTSYNNELIGLSTSIGNCEVSLEHTSEDIYSYYVNIGEIANIYENIPLVIDGLELNGSISDESLVLDNLSANLSGLHVNGAGRTVFGIDTTIAVTLKIEGNPRSLLDTVLTIYSIPGISLNKDLLLSVNIDGNLNFPRLSAELNIPEIQSSIGNIDDFSISITYENDSVTLSSLKVDVFDGIIKANGFAKIDSQFSGTTDISITNIDMAQVWQTVYKEESPYEGQLNGKISIAAPSENIFDWQIDSKLSASRAKYMGKIIPDFYLNAGLNNGLGSFRVHHPEFEMSLNSTISDSTIDGNYSINILNAKPLAEILGITEVDGKIDISGRISGTYESPDINAHINAENLSYNNFPIDNLDADVSYNNDLLNISSMNFSGRLDSIDSSSPPFGIDSLSGGITYSGRASGSLDSIKADLDVELYNPRYSEWGTDYGRLYISANGNSINIDNSYFEKNLQIFNIDGSYNIDDSKGKLKLSLFHDKTGTISAGDINLDFQYKENDALLLMMQGRDTDIALLSAIYSDTLIVGGLLNFDLSLEGELTNPTAQLNLRAVNPMFNDISIDSVIAEIAVVNRELEVPLFELYEGEHLLKSSGSLALEQDSLGYLTVTDNSSIGGKLYYNDWDMAILNPFLQEQAKISGVSSLNVAIDGTLGAPQFTGFIEIDKSDIILFPESDSITGLSLLIAIEDSIFTFKHFCGVINTIPFEISGNMTISKNQDFYSDLLFSIPEVGYLSARGGLSSEKLDYKLEIDDLNLSLLEPFVPSVKRLEGQLNGQALVSGDADDPSISGNLSIRQLSFQPEVLPSPFTDGVITIKFDKKTVVLDSLFLKLNNGSMTISGTLTHENGEIINMDFSTTINNLRISQPKEYEIDVQLGALRYWGEKGKFFLDGDIQFGETKLLTKVKAQSILPWAQTVEKAQPDLPSFLEQTEINVRVRESDKLWIDNNLAHIRLHSELGFIGSPIQPNITGRLSIDEGYVIYLDRKFKVKRGIIFFNDPFKFNPEIDLVAETQVKSYQALESQTYIIRIEISGDLDELSTEVYSEPPLDKTDIMALLTLGATRAQLSGKDTESGDISTKDILLERAAMLSSQRISGYVSQRMGTFLGLDEVSVEGNLFKFDKSWGPQLLASKKLSERMSLTYKTTVGHMNDQSIKLNYKLTRKFSLEGQTDRQGRSGLDLIYGLRFK